jgi:Asp-tRNA(Asn)/Glu-tRNA(Gln) amidotransferase A subunit family amidase
MCRTVEDAVRVLDVVSGYDPADSVTERSIGVKPDSYLGYLKPDGLKGKRIGVFRYYTDQATTDPEVLGVFEGTLKDLSDNGAEIVDPFDIPDFEKLTDDIWCNTFKRDLKQYLESLDNPPYRSVEEVYATGLHSEYIDERLKNMAESDPEPACGDLYSEPRNIKLRETIVDEMNKHRLEAFVYPTWSNPPRLIGDTDSPAGDNSQKIPPHTGLPGFTIPMGYTYGGLPSGLQIVGRLFSEPTLIEIAYGYEQATSHRRPPEGFWED